MLPDGIRGASRLKCMLMDAFKSFGIFSMQVLIHKDGQVTLQVRSMSQTDLVNQNYSVYLHNCNSNDLNEPPQLKD
jgi:hypothetical protein